MPKRTAAEMEAARARQFALQLRTYSSKAKAHLTRNTDWKQQPSRSQRGFATFQPLREGEQSGPHPAMRFARFAFQPFLVGLGYEIARNVTRERKILAIIPITVYKVHDGQRLCNVSLQI
jgi:hypothetical protein